VQISKAAGFVGCHLFGGLAPVVDLDTRLVLVQARNCQRSFAHIDAGDRGAQPRHPFSQQAAPAADVDGCASGQRRLAVNVLEAQRVDIVQRFELAVRVPPARGQFLELVDFSAIDVVSCGGHGHKIPGAGAGGKVVAVGLWSRPA